MPFETTILPRASVDYHGSDKHAGGKLANFEPYSLKSPSLFLFDLWGRIDIDAFAHLTTRYSSIFDSLFTAKNQFSPRLPDR